MVSKIIGVDFVVMYVIICDVIFVNTIVRVVDLIIMFVVLISVVVKFIAICALYVDFNVNAIIVACFLDVVIDDLYVII
jgi:hypothetical protein